MHVSPSNAQKSTHKHVCGRVSRFPARLNGVCGPNLQWKNRFSACENMTLRSTWTLAEVQWIFPLLQGLLTPCSLVSEELRALISTPFCLFPRAAYQACKANLPSRIPERKRLEYVRLTVRELNCGKLRLQKLACGQGGVFAAQKS